MPRKGNPNWSAGLLPPIPIVATEFEREIRRLGLNLKTCVRSSELRHWCERNKDHRYIPEWLLEAWGIDVDVLATSRPTRAS
jgi:hypothetical protein